MANNQKRKEELQTAFEFNEEELGLNQAAKLSARQKKILGKARQMRGCGRQAALYGLGGTAGLFAVLFVYLLVSGRLASLAAIIAIGGVLAVFVGITVFAFVQDYTRGQDLKSGRITVIEGKASGHQEKKVRGEPGMLGDFMEYYVRIGERRMRVHSPQQLEALRGELSYRMYLIKNPPVDIVLSVEVVG